MWHELGKLLCKGATCLLTCIWCVLFAFVMEWLGVRNRMVNIIICGCQARFIICLTQGSICLTDFSVCSTWCLIKNVDQEPRLVLCTTRCYAMSSCRAIPQIPFSRPCHCNIEIPVSAQLGLRWWVQFKVHFVRLTFINTHHAWCWFHRLPSDAGILRTNGFFSDIQVSLTILLLKSLVSDKGKHVLQWKSTCWATLRFRQSKHLLEER